MNSTENARIFIHKTYWLCSDVLSTEFASWIQDPVVQTAFQIGLICTFFSLVEFHVFCVLFAVGNQLGWCVFFFLFWLFVCWFYRFILLYLGFPFVHKFDRTMGLYELIKWLQHHPIHALHLRHVKWETEEKNSDNERYTFIFRGLQTTTAFLYVYILQAITVRASKVLRSQKGHCINKCNKRKKKNEPKERSKNSEVAPNIGASLIV